MTLRQKQDLGLTPRSPEQRQKDEKEDVRQLERFRDLVKAAAEARTEELRRQRSQDLEEWTRSETANHQAAQKAAMVKVLRPEQWQRLVELDLQWRGPLALSDPDVVGLVDVNRENYASVAAIAQAFSSSITRAERDFAQDRGYQLLAQAQNNRFSPLRKKADTLKWAAEMLALSLLSDSETQRWIAAQGKPFVFRATQ